MGKKYNVSKFIEMVKVTEGKVSEMYVRLSTKVTDEKAKNLLLKLADDEKGHENMYAQILSKFPADYEIALPEDEIEYNDNLIETNLFINESAKQIYGKMSALAVAEKIERDSILYYNQMINMFPNIFYEELRLILAQEKKHLKYVMESQFLSEVPSPML